MEIWLAEGVDARTLPKVLLHDHLDGGLRPQTLIELAAERRIDLPVPDAAELADWFVAETGSLPEYLRRFDVPLAVLQDADALHRVAREAVDDLAADGVIYAEVRWAPEQHRRVGLHLDDAIAAVTAGLREGCAEHPEIRVGQLICAMRQQDAVAEVAQAALRCRGDGELGGVWGFDLAGPEVGFPPSAHRDVFTRLAAECFPVTLHAGEAAGLESITSALVDARALRLGHGVRIADDIRIEATTGSGGDAETNVSLGRIAAWVRDREIPLEVAVTSNLQTGVEVAGRRVETAHEHPFDLLYQLGFTVTVNTDNRTVSGTTASLELQQVADAFDLRLGDLEQLELNAAAAAFAPLEVREELAEQLADAYEVTP